MRRLHIGAGDKYWPGFVNIDFDGDQDWRCDITKLKMYDDDSVDEIHGIHVFEHLNRVDAQDAVREWRRVLKPGGKLVLEMPCFDKIIGMINQGETNIRMTLWGLFGDPRYRNEHMQHRWCYSEGELADLMKELGFDAAITEPVYHFAKRDMRCEAIKTTTN
jgi:predicted SAM-dependent methyltransferase